MIGEYKKEYKKEEEERLVAGGKDPLDKWVKKKKKEGAVEDAVEDAAEDAALDAALEPALWVERGHSHVHCAVADCACKYGHSPLYVHEAAFNSAISENWFCAGKEMKLEWSSVLCRSGAYGRATSALRGYCGGATPCGSCGGRC